MPGATASASITASERQIAVGAAPCPAGAEIDPDDRATLRALAPAGRVANSQSSTSGAAWYDSSPAGRFNLKTLERSGEP